MRKLTLIISLAALLLFAGGILAFYFYMSTKPQPTGVNTTSGHFVSIEESAYIKITPGDAESPTSVERMTQTDAGPSKLWQTDLQGWTSAPASARLDDTGKLLFVDLQDLKAEKKATAVVRVGDGRLLGRLARSHFSTIAQDGLSLLSHDNESLRLSEITSSGLEERWSVDIGNSEFVPRLGLTRTHALAFDGDLHSLDRSSGARMPLNVEGEVDSVGLVSDTLLLWHDGDVIKAHPLDNSASIALQLDGRPINGIDSPCLLGTSGSAWIVVYATTVDHLRTNKSGGWTQPGLHFMAAVDPSSGRQLWSLELGQWSVECRPLIGRSDKLLEGPSLRGTTILYTSRDTGTSGVEAALLWIDLDSGEVTHRSHFQQAASSNTLFLARGQAWWLRVPSSEDALRSALVRLSGEGKITGAVWLPGHSAWAPALSQDNALLKDNHGRLIQISGPELNALHLPEGAAQPEDAAEWARARMGLPPH